MGFIAAHIFIFIFVEKTENPDLEAANSLLDFEPLVNLYLEVFRFPLEK